MSAHSPWYWTYLLLRSSFFALSAPLPLERHLIYSKPHPWSPFWLHRPAQGDPTRNHIHQSKPRTHSSRSNHILSRCDASCPSTSSSIETPFANGISDDDMLADQNGDITKSSSVAKGNREMRLHSPNKGHPIQSDLPIHSIPDDKGTSCAEGKLIHLKTL